MESKPANVTSAVSQGVAPGPDTMTGVPPASAVADRLLSLAVAAAGASKACLKI